MKKNKTSFLLLIYAFIAVVSLSAQDYKADFEKATSIYKEDAVEMEVTQLFFPSLTTSQHTEKEIITAYKKGDNYRVKQYGIELIYTSEYVVMINEKERIVGINKRKHEPQSEAKPDEEQQKMLDAFSNLMTALGIDSINDNKQKEPDYAVKYTGKKQGLKSYELTFKEGSVLEKMQVYLSEKTGLFSKTVCVFKEPVEVEPGVFKQVRIEFLYTKQLVNKAMDDALFDLKNILTVNKNQEVLLVDKYATYYLINNLRSF